MTHRPVSATFTLLFLVGACRIAPSRPELAPTAEVTLALANANAAFAAALRSGDARAVAAHFTEDALLMNPRRPDVQGRSDIEVSFRSAFEWVSIKEVSFTPVETEVLATRAYQRTVFRERVEWLKGGKPPAVDEGRALFAWTLGPDGRWRIHRVLVNTTMADSPLH